MLFVMFSSFGLVQLVQLVKLTRTGKQGGADYQKIEMAYISLSFIAKALLPAVFTYGLTQRSEITKKHKAARSTRVE